MSLNPDANIWINAEIWIMNEGGEVSDWYSSLEWTFFLL